MIVSKTPFRMSFVGGGSDLPAFYREETGAVLSTSIDKYMYIAVNKKFDERLRISYSRTEEVETPQQVAHPLVRHALDIAGIDGGIEIASMADIPSRGTGLGSSSAYTVGLLNALFAYRNEYASKERLARLACNIEIDRCGEPIGKQDQYAAVVRRPESGPISSRRIGVRRSSDLRAGAADHNWRRPRWCSTPAARGRRRRFWPNRRENIAAHRPLMRRMVQLAFELKKELESGQLDSVGSILDENWCLKRQMGGGVGCQHRRVVCHGHGERRARRQTARRRLRRFSDVLCAAGSAHAHLPHVARPEADQVRLRSHRLSDRLLPAGEFSMSTTFSAAQLSRGARRLSREGSTSALSKTGISMVRAAFEPARQIITCGNGGSAHAASHYITDWNKMVNLATGRKFRGISLCDNIGIVTAFANDIAFEEIFAGQLKSILEPAIWPDRPQRQRQLRQRRAGGGVRQRGRGETLAVVGYDGGRLKQIASTRSGCPRSTCSSARTCT